MGEPIPTEAIDTIQALQAHTKALFGGRSFDDIANQLRSSSDPWAVGVLNTLSKMSPTSLKVCAGEGHGG